MPNEALQAAIKEAYAIAPSDKVIYHTLEVRQLGVQDSIYVVRARIGITALDENDNQINFQPANFQFSLPPVTEEGFQSLNVAVDNINRRASDFIEVAKSEEIAVEMVYRPYVSTGTAGSGSTGGSGESSGLGALELQMNPPLILFLKDVQIVKDQVIGRATFMDIANKKFPSELYTRTRFPTLG